MTTSGLGGSSTGGTTTGASGSAGSGGAGQVNITTPTTCWFGSFEACAAAILPAACPECLSFMLAM